MPTIGTELNAIVRAIVRCLALIRREFALTWQAVAEFPGSLAGHRGEFAQMFAKHTAVVLLAQLTTTVVLMIWIARTV